MTSVLLPHFPLYRPACEDKTHNPVPIYREAGGRRLRTHDPCVSVLSRCILTTQQVICYMESHGMEVTTMWSARTERNGVGTRVERREDCRGEEERKNRGEEQRRGEERSGRREDLPRHAVPSDSAGAVRRTDRCI